MNYNLHNGIINSNYKFLDTTNIIHKSGFILNLETNKLIYPKKISNYIYYNKKKIYFPSLMLKYFYNLDKIKANNIIHLDHNRFNNDISNLLYSKNSKESKKNIYNYPIHYLFIIHKYNNNYQLLQSYSDSRHIKDIKFHKSYNFMLNLLNNINNVNNINKNYYYLNNYYWTLEIKKIELNNYYNYTSLYNNLYYISNDQSHIINKLTNTIIKINMDNCNNHYVTLYIDHIKSIKYILTFYNYSTNNIKSNNIENNIDIKPNFDISIDYNENNDLNNNLNNNLNQEDLFKHFNDLDIFPLFDLDYIFNNNFITSIPSI